MSLTALREAIDDLMEHAAAFGDGESVVASQRELSRLEAFVTKVTAGLDASGEWAIVGARNCASYVAAETHLPMREARRRVSLGRKLREMPCTAESFEDGDISKAHAEALSAARNPRTEKHFERDEPMLLSYARELGFAEFTRLVSYWEQHADPDGSDDAAAARHARRSVRLDSSYDGMFFGKMVLDPISGSIVGAELDRLERQLFEAEWAAASERLGREPKLSDLPRRPDQRRADALVEMATRSGTAPSDGRRPAPLFSVLVDFETLSGRVLELANGVVIAPNDLVSWLTIADVERGVFTPEGRVEVSRTSRLFTGATRRAIQLRDRRCTHGYCEEPLDRCEVDHIVPYGEGGLTTQENGRLLCGFHHRLRAAEPPPDRTHFVVRR
jgi:hypothetical protein